MNCFGKKEFTCIKLLGIFIGFWMVSFSGSAWSQSDPFGQMDMFYIDSVVASPGQVVPVHFYIKNDEAVSAATLPIVYDTTLLTLKSISFTGAREEYIANKFITPAVVDSIKGHFMLSFFILLENPLPPGDGLVGTALFEVSKTAQRGTSITVDSLFYPPGGELILVENSSAQIIRPIFKAGKIVVGDDNKPPVLATLPEQNVFEGDSLVLNITATDQNNDSLVWAATNLPTGAKFVDNHNGSATLSWRPDFIGPYSADGSPFKVSLWVSDGDLSATSEVTINVINKNRKPIISVEDSLQMEAGHLVEIPVSAYDPDFETITWQVNGLPFGATFDNKNPGRVSWATSVSDTGMFNIVFIARDPEGYADTSRSKLTLMPASVYTLSLDTASAYPGDRVSYNITLDNLYPVSSFNILFGYDPTALSIENIVSDSTRAAQFEYFNVTYNENSNPGVVRVEGIANLNGGTSVPILSAGEGSIAKISFKIVGNIAFSGMEIPVRFKFLDGAFSEDNTLTDSIGDKIDSATINYYDGYVKILSLGEVKIGDINLNGVAYEISDAIYFTNYFMNIALYPLNPLQYVNSDVNHDNIGGTIGDLVTLINIISYGSSGTSKITNTDNPEATIQTETTSEGLNIGYQSDFDIGAIFMTFQADSDIFLDSIENYTDNMTVDVNRTDGEVKILVYSLKGNYMSAGEKNFLSIKGVDKATLKTVEMAKADGQDVKVIKKENSQSLPEEFNLYQNYPNPFNPETRIDFDLPQSGQTRLVVYNILGEKVRNLIDENLPAGRHSIMWDGHDNRGQAVSSGIYLYRLETKTGQSTRKMMLLK